MKLGFIGLGSIGNPMATNLVKAGHRVTVHDLQRQRAEGLLALGACWAGSPEETAAAGDVLFTSLPGPKQVQSVLEGERGAVGGLAAGSIWVDMSTTDLAQTKRLAALLAGRGVATLEAPVTGGVANAHAGKITIFVGGPEETYRQVLPLLSAMGKEIIHLGPIGSATIVKLITNFMCFIHEVALGEGLVLGTSLGIDTIKLWEAIKVSYADSFVARVDGPDLFSGAYGDSFSIALACKDIGLSLALAREAGLKLEATELIDRLYSDARAKYGDAAGCLHAVRQLEERSGISLRRTLPAKAAS